MSAYTINWETYRNMQSRIIDLEKKALEAAAKEMLLLVAEEEINELKHEVKTLKGEAYDGQ